MTLLPLAAALLVAPAPDAVTPQGPATLRATWLGASPSILFPPRVIVRWRVQVGKGGAGGPVALRVLTGSPVEGEAKALQRGPVEQLPAAPGVYEFPARLRFLTGDALGLDQQTGGHAIVAQHEDAEPDRWADPYELHALDVWRPPMADGETRARSDRVQGAQLLIAPELEHDVDADGFGDKTQDRNDLSISARPGRRSVLVRVRNRGARAVQHPRLLVRMHGARLLNRPWRSGPVKAVPSGYLRVDLRAIAPGRSATKLLRASRGGFRVKVIADSEGFDPTRSRLVVRARSG